MQCVRKGLSYTAVSPFVANLNLFTDSITNYKGIQRGVFGMSVVKDAPHIMQYKIINL